MSSDLNSVCIEDATALCNVLLKARADGASLDSRCDLVLHGACQLLDAKLVFLGRTRVMPGGAAFQLIDGRQYGSITPDEQRAVNEYFADTTAVPDPAHTACLRRMDTKPVSLRHQDLVSEAEWTSSPNVQRCRWSSGVDAALYAATPAPIGDHHWDCFSFHRAKGAPAFSERDRDLAMLLLHTSTWLFDDIRAAARGQSLIAELTPRLRQALQRFLEGDSEKDAAAALGLSRHTIHHYSKQLYARYGVGSRAELLAACRAAGIKPEALTPIPGSSGRPAVFGDKAKRELRAMNNPKNQGKKR